MGSSRRITVALVGLVVLVVGGWLIRDVTDGSGAQPPATGPELPVRALSELPDEAAGTWRLIEAGGPFPGAGDGGGYANPEHLLPAEEPGYYRTYTVSTPGADGRGQRRMVTGSAGELYYTDDGYRSFVAVDPRR